MPRYADPDASAPAAQGFAQTPQGRIWYRSTGGGDQTPLVLVHGGPGSPSDYLSPLEALADERRVIRYDQLGCGRSDPPEDAAAQRIDVFVDHLHLLVQELGLERFHLFGHSWGGMLALAYHEAHPDRAASLILASPLIDTARWVADADELIAQLPRDHRTAILAGPEHPGYSAAETEFYRRHFCKLDPWPAPLQASMDRMDTTTYNAMWGPNEFTQSGNLRGESRSGVLAGLALPNLWLAGSEDEARPGTLREFAAASPASSVHVFPGGTHSVHLEQPEAYLTVLRDFLSGG